MLRPPSFATRGRELWRVDGLGDVHLACVPRPLWQVRVERKRHSEKRKGRGSDGEEFAGTGGQGGRGVRARGAGDPVTRAWRGADQGEGVRDLLQRSSGEGRRVAGADVSACARARGRRRDRRSGRGRDGMEEGDRVGVGWHGGHDFVCPSCRRGDFVTCANEAITGITRDGGYAQYMLARHEAVALLPDGLDGAEAGPLMCAGITTFNALRNSGARAGDLVGVLGIGGLGHLGIQYAAKSGYRVVGVGRGPENAALAKKLGAFAYIDSKATKPAEELQKLGGAKVILATAPSAKAIAELVDGLSVGGKLVIVGAPVEPMEISVLQLLLARRAIQGWPSGTAMDSQETLQFSAFAGVRPMIEKYPLAKVKDAYERMTSGHAEFRVVLTVD